MRKFSAKYLHEVDPGFSGEELFVQFFTQKLHKNRKSGLLLHPLDPPLDTRELNGYGILYK